jgi:hypothetical protein
MVPAVKRPTALTTAELTGPQPASAGWRVAASTRSPSSPSTDREPAFASRADSSRIMRSELKTSPDSDLRLVSRGLFMGSADRGGVLSCCFRFVSISSIFSLARSTSFPEMLFFRVTMTSSTSRRPSPVTVRAAAGAPKDPNAEILRFGGGLGEEELEDDAVRSVGWSEMSIAVMVADRDRPCARARGV